MKSKTKFLTVDDAAPTPWKLIGRGHHISPHGLSDTCISLAREWLDLCTHAKGKHKTCTQVSVPELPTRVVFIGHHETPPRLVVPEAGQRAHYAALSHCWGGRATTMTTTHNLHQYTQSLPDELPQTFLDAMRVARALGLQYIWIDSLCIVQDSPEDWRREAPRMAQVYTNALVTISADAAPDSTTGFLDAPAREAPPRFTLQYRQSEKKSTAFSFGSSSSSSSSSEVVYLRQRGFLAEELPFHTWTTAPSDSGRSKLASRGWVFQERILSPRTLHFSTNEMAWECRSVCECECSATSLRTLRTRSILKHFLHPPADADPRAVNVSSIEESWRDDVVPAYTRLDLTVETDRLAAVEGLARAAGTLRRGDQYLFGLWRNSLAADLLWTVSSVGDKGSRRIAGGRCTPSWSWGSVTGSITYRTSLGTAGVDRGLSLSVVDGSESAEGQSWPVLSIEGHLVKVRVMDEWSDDHSTATPAPDITLAIVWDVLSTRERANEFAGATGTVGKAWYYFLVFGSSANGNGPFGLLLHRVQTQQGPDESEVSAVYRRIGYILGYRATRRLRRWGSGGWTSESDEGDDVPEFIRGGGTRDKWLGRVLQGEITRLKLV